MLSGFELYPRWVPLEGDTFGTTFHLVCCLFHTRPCRLSGREKMTHY